MTVLLEVEDLTVDIGPVRIVDRVGFAVGAGERVALVGESGSGKSVTAQALLRLNPRARVGGRLRFAGEDLLAKTDREMNAVRGAGIGLAFQDASVSLDPIMPVGAQVAEALRLRGVAGPRRGGGPWRCWRSWACRRRAAGSAPTCTSSPAASGSVSCWPWP